MEECSLGLNWMEPRRCVLDYRRRFFLLRRSDKRARKVAKRCSSVTIFALRCCYVRTGLACAAGDTPVKVCGFFRAGAELDLLPGGPICLDRFLSGDHRRRGSREAQARLPRRACLTCFLACWPPLRWVGSFYSRCLASPLPAFEIAGGLILMLIADRHAGSPAFADAGEYERSRGGSAQGGTPVSCLWASRCLPVRVRSRA